MRNSLTHVNRGREHHWSMLLCRASPKNYRRFRRKSLSTLWRARWEQQRGVRWGRWRTSWWWLWGLKICLKNFEVQLESLTRSACWYFNSLLLFYTFTTRARARARGRNTLKFPVLLIHLRPSSHRKHSSTWVVTARSVHIPDGHLDAVLDRPLQTAWRTKVFRYAIDHRHLKRCHGSSCIPKYLPSGGEINIISGAFSTSHVSHISIRLRLDIYLTVIDISPHAISIFGIGCTNESIYPQAKCKASHHCADRLAESEWASFRLFKLACRCKSFTDPQC